MSTLSDDAEALRPLAWARIGFCIVFLIRTTPVIQWLDPSIADSFSWLMGWPVEGALRTAAFGLVLSDDVVRILCVVRTAAVISLLIGYRSLPSGVVAGISGYLVVLQNAFGFTFTQHLLCLGVLVLGLVDCGTTLAVRPDPPRSPATSRLLLWGFVASIYFWAGWGKLRADWFDGRTLELFLAEGKLRGMLADLLLDASWKRATAATSVAVLELSLPLLLLHPSLRRVGMLLAFGMHLLIEPMGHPDVLGWCMIALLMSFARPAPLPVDRGRVEPTHGTDLTQ